MTSIEIDDELEPLPDLTTSDRQRLREGLVQLGLMRERIRQRVGNLAG